MSVESMALVLHHSRAKGTAKVVALGIANHDGDGGAWPSVATLARYANVHPRSVQRHLDTLVRLGEVERHVQAGGTLVSHDSDYLRPNRYVLLVECPEGCARDANHNPARGWKRTPSGEYLPVDNHPTDRVTDLSGGDGTVTRGGDTGATQTVQSTGPTTGSASTTGVTPPCTTCSAPNMDECHRRQLKLHSDDRHTYSPRPWRARGEGA